MKGGAHREFAGLARLLGRMLQQFTKHEGRQWPPVFDAVARALAARAAVRDNRPEVALPPSPDQAIGVCQAGGGGGIDGIGAPHCAAHGVCDAPPSIAGEPKGFYFTGISLGAFYGTRKVGRWIFELRFRIQ